MTAYKDKTWDERVATLGDEAELRFTSWATKNNLGYDRYGLDRPPLRMYELPARLRYTPDFLMSRQFVEVQGLGRDQVFKLKMDKHGALHYWCDLHPVYLFVWDSHHQRECFIHLHDLDHVIGQYADMKQFHEGKPYFAVPADAVFLAGKDKPER